MPEAAARRLPAELVGLPRFAVPEPAPGAPPPDIFDLSSHVRARDALAFGLSIADPGFNIFVLGEDRSGRMTATLERLEAYVRTLPRPPDWLYLNNFARPARPKPYRLPAGVGRRFRERLEQLVPELRKALDGAFDTPAIARLLQREGEQVQHLVEEEFETLRAFAAERELQLERTEKGVAVAPGPLTDPKKLAELPVAERARIGARLEQVRDRIQAYRRRVREHERGFAKELEQLRRAAAAEAMAPVLDPIESEFGVYPGLRRWLVELRADILDNLDLLAGAREAGEERKAPAAEDRYAANLLVDHADDAHPLVVVEPNPTYENLFGRIEYRHGSSVADTDFTLIRSGALHRANGGVLVLRAEAVAKDAEAWRFLKDALRDLCIRIEERHREGGTPMAGAPQPKSIRLDVKVVIVGAPRWYYTFFSGDPEFATYFKVKADIDPDMPADAANVAVYAGLVRSMAAARNRAIEGAAIERLLGEASRWASDRRKLSARFELVEDIVSETARLAGAPRETRAVITPAHVRRALDERRRRNARIEDRTHEAIRDGMVMIETKGARVGEVNALVVRDQGDHAFGVPSRVTARTYVGRHGIVNIERSTELGGPIQQKGVLVIAGYLAGRFARTFPLSFAASLTFEQNYGGVEGDSASLAELLAILSALAEVPLRQDIAVTGSVNQLGETQAVGGIEQKVEGFHRVCAERGLSGSEGVLLPAANEPNLVLDERVAEDVAAGRFHVWSVRDIDAALGLLGGLAPEEVARRAGETLERYDALMRERAQLWQ
jgi:predicted ATP-dependent protease